jgi:hypothetical protein
MRHFQAPGERVSEPGGTKRAIESQRIESGFSFIPVAVSRYVSKNMRRQNAKYGVSVGTAHTGILPGTKLRARKLS